MVESDEQSGGVSPHAADQEWLRTYLSEHPGEVEPGTRLHPPEKKPGFALFAVVLMVLAAIGAAVFVARSSGSLPFKPKSGPNDLGQGISSASGIRGHLVAEWQANTARYKLKIEPIDARNEDGFARAAAGNVLPVYLNVRILDAGGNTVCGKQIVLPPKGAPARQNDLDRFKRLAGTTGQVEGLWAEGTLPCSSDQYRRFDFWDFATNFPSVAEQDRMLGIAPPEPVERVVAANPRPTTAVTTGHPVRAIASRRRAANKKPQSAFLLQGDDHVTAFEAGRNVLTIGPGKSFVVLRATDLQAAAAWADDAALVHYTCDQRAVCALRRSGSAAVVVARMSN